MNSTIEIQNLHKYYGEKHALSDINLTINQGMFGLLGRNGAGKTTLMKTLATLLQKNGGSITVCGVPIRKAKEIRKIVGYLPQEFSMYPTMSVYDAMDYLGILSGIATKERKERIEMLLGKELKKTVFSLSFVILLVVLIILPVSQEVISFRDDVIYEPQQGGDFGIHQKEVPEIIMPAALQSLLREFSKNEYIAYPIGFFKFDAYCKLVYFTMRQSTISGSSRDAATKKCRSAICRRPRWTNSVR